MMLYFISIFIMSPFCRCKAISDSGVFQALAMLTQMRCTARYDRLRRNESRSSGSLSSGYLNLLFYREYEISAICSR